MVWARLGRVVRSCIHLPSCRPRDPRYLPCLRVSGAQVTEGVKLKKVDDLPGISQLEIMYWLFLRGYLFNMHDLEVRLKKKHGPMWVYTMSGTYMVSIASPEILESLIKQEGKYPMRADMHLWKAYRDLRGYAYGPLTEEGHRWYSLRSALNPKILKPTAAAQYMDTLNDVVPDLLNRIKELRAESPSGLVVKNVGELMYKFAFESICRVIFETKVGCLKSQLSKETQKFISSVGLLFENEIYLERLPWWSRNWLPYWGRFVEAWDTLYDYGKNLIDKKVKDIEERLKKGEDLGGSYLVDLLTNGNLSIREVYGVMPEILQAGVDTSSNTMAWALYELARNPEIQEDLYEEVISVIPGDKVPTREDISRMPLLKAVIKETLRMYPVVPANGRIVTDKEAILEGYVFPKQTQFVLCHYVMSHDETNFPEHDRFLPQRWLRSLGIKHHPFSSIPFGHGVRACLGRRVAELEMHLAVSQMIRQFKVLLDPEMGDVKTRHRIVLVSSIPIDLQFIDRREQL